LIAPDALFNDRRVQLAILTARHGIAAISWDRLFPEAGGLMSYGTNISDQIRQAGMYTGRILKGDKPGDRPVMLATKFEFVITRATAKALGLSIPETLLATADGVIQ
jgi:putative ABC transport system substrate-binding protein